MARSFIKKIYLDYAATTPVDPAVEKAMRPYFGRKFGNPGSLHFFGQEAMAGVDESREKIAASLNADFREIVFTGSATEANNLALRGVVKFFSSPTVAFRNQNNFAPAAKFSFPSARRYAKSVDQAGAPAGYSLRQSALSQNISPLRIIISAIEHESVLGTARDLENNGIEVIYLPVSQRGFEAIELYKKGNFEELKNYCINDVKLTKDLYEMAQNQGYLWVPRRDHPEMIKLAFNYPKEEKVQAQLL